MPPLQRHDLCGASLRRLQDQDLDCVSRCHLCLTHVLWWVRGHLRIQTKIDVQGDSLRYSLCLVMWGR